MFRTCTSVPLYLCIFAGGKVRTYLLGNLHIGQADKIQCQDLHVFFFSWGNFSLLVHTGRLEDDRSDGCWALGVFFFFFSFFSFFLFSFFLACVSKVLGRKKEGPKVGKKDT